MTAARNVPRAADPDDVIAQIVLCLLKADRNHEVDLGDKRSVDACLAAQGFAPDRRIRVDEGLILRVRTPARRRPKVLGIEGSSGPFVIVLTAGSALSAFGCSPARASGASARFLGHVDFASLGTWAPIFIAMGMLLWVLWMDLGVRPPPIDPDPPVFDAPPTAPALSSLEKSFRDADRG